MTSRNGHRPITARDRVLERYAAQQSMALDRFSRAEQTARLRNRLTWYNCRPTLAIAMTAARVSKDNPPTAFALGSLEHLQQVASDLDLRTEHWAETLLHCPSLSGNRHTARFAGKPYHWRQDYTGQLKLAAGESPW